jgi:hypothetical protein
VLAIDRRFWAFLSVWATVGFASLVPACSKKSDEAAKPPLTQAQRDSAIAASQLPGAGVVGKALEVSDSAEARAEESNREP